MKFHAPVVETLPPNAAFPTTLTVVKDALVMFALLTFALAMETLPMVASPMLAFGMVAVPVNVGASMGAFSKLSELSAAIRVLISWFIALVKMPKCGTMFEFVVLPITTSVINVL